MVATPSTPDSNQDLASMSLEVQSAANSSSEPTGYESGSTTWGQGEGLNGDVIRPDSIDSLIDIIDRIEFGASIDSDSYIRSSTLNSSIHAYNQDGDFLFVRNSYDHAEAGSLSGGHVFNSAVYTDTNDILTTAESYSSTFVDSATDTYSTSDQLFDFSAGYSTDVEYSEGLKNNWHQRELLRQIAASNPSASGGAIDNGTNTEDLTYLFVRPDNITNRGVISLNNSQQDYNSQPSDFASLSETAPLVLELNQELMSQIHEAIESEIVFDKYQIQSFTNDAGDAGNITIQLSDYIDDDGHFDILALNSDQRFTLQLSNDIAQKLTSTDQVWSNVNLRSESDINGNSHYLYLNAYDHDAAIPYDTMYGGEDDIKNIVEDDGYSNSTIELSLRPFDNLPSEITDGQSSQITYYLRDAGASFDTLKGYYSGHLGEIELDQQLTNSIQSITLDFTGLELGGLNESLEVSIAPATTLIDFSKLNDDFDIIDFGYSDLNYGHFYADYELRSLTDDRHIGSFNIRSDYEPYYDDWSSNFSGNIWNDGDIYEDVSTRLSRLYLHGETSHGNDGSVSLGFSYDQQNDSVNLDYVDGWGWGEEYDSDGEARILPSTINLNWEQFSALELINLQNGIYDHNTSQVYIDTYLDTGFRGDEALAFTYALSNAYDTQALSQNAVLGDSVDYSKKYDLNIFAESLADDFRIEGTDFTIDFNPLLFENISTSDIRIDGVMPVANAVSIDNEAGTIRIAAASLSDLTGYDSYTGMWDQDLGGGIGAGSQKLATISLDFSESQIEGLAKNPDGSLMINPLAFNIKANLDETTFSRDFTDDTNQLNREILTLGDLGGGVAVDGQDVTLYEAKINFEQLEDGLVIGTDRVIGADSSFTNLVRSGDLVTTASEWLNVGNIQANNLVYYELYNQNATLENAEFSQTSVSSGSFEEGLFMEYARESTTLTTDIRITGAAGNVVDLSDGIVSIQADGSEVFTNEGKGSSNLITFQGDLNYDGRVSMKDLAYLNAGAARQQLVTTVDQNGNTIEVASEASYARDVDADFSGKIDLADLSVLDADWGKTLHTGDQQFQGSSDVSWSELDEQGADSSWDNDSFKDQNEIETYDDYVGSLESPAVSNVIGADGNTSPNDGDSTATYFQETV